MMNFDDPICYGSYYLQVFLSMYGLLLPPGLKGLIMFVGNVLDKVSAGVQVNMQAANICEISQ